MVTTTGNIGERNRTGDQLNYRYSEINYDTTAWRRKSYDPTQQHTIDINLNYKFDFKADKGSLTADFSQSIGRENIQGYYENDTISLMTQPVKQQLFNTERNNVTTAQSDLLYLFPKVNGRLETGIKAIIRGQSVNTYSEKLDAVSGTYLKDTLANFNYKYTENIYSVYGLYGQQIKKVRVQVGVRMEKAYQIPNLVSDSIRIVNDYFNIFPSGHIRYNLKDKAELSLSYSKRITRASSANLNPFTSYADPYNLQKGNPYLQPEYIDSYDLGYSKEFKKTTMTASVFYRHNTGVISRIKEFYSNNTSAVTYANLDQSNSVGLEAVCIVKPYKWWRNTVSFNGNYIAYKDKQFNSNWNASGFNWNMKYTGIVDFWKKTASVQLTASYNAPRITIQGKAQRRGPVDLAADKSFKKGKWTVGMRISDIFNRQGFYMTVNQNGIYQQSDFKWLTRRFYVTFSYKFGKMEITNKAKLSGSDGGFDM
jgi:outer membrane receptor protein involved in Fe transport